MSSQFPPGKGYRNLPVRIFNDIHCRKMQTGGRCNCPFCEEDSDIPSWKSVHSKKWTSSMHDSSTKNHVPQQRRMPRGNWDLGLPRYLHPDGRDLDASVSYNGYVSIRLDKYTRIDITLDYSIRVSNELRQTFIAVSGCDSRWAFKHECGQIVRMNDTKKIQNCGHVTTDDVIDGVVFCRPQKMKFVKMIPNGIIFGCEASAVTFKTDPTGTKTGSQKFLLNLSNEDYSKRLIMNHSIFGVQYRKTAHDLESRIKHRVDPNGTQSWTIDTIKIWKNDTGVIKISKGPNSHLKIGLNGKAGLSVGNDKVTASWDEKQQHLFARSGPNRIHFDGKRFAVRHLTQSAGFDEEDKIKIF